MAKEFPTAPTDSFVVADAGYVARATGSDAVGTFLVQTDGSGARAVAGRLRQAVGPTAKVTDIQDSRRVVGSNLTAVELSGLTRVELGFALLLAPPRPGLLSASDSASAAARTRSRSTWEPVAGSSAGSCEASRPSSPPAASRSAPSWPPRSP